MTTTRRLADILGEIRTANANGTVFTVEQLRTFVAQASAEFRGAAADAITLLYSGDMSDGKHAWQIADEVVAANSPGAVKTLTTASVDVAELLDDDEFKKALSAAVESYTPASGVDAEISRVLNGSTLNGERVPDGLWDDASRRFAQNASGDVRIIAPDGKAASVLAQSELPELLKNSKVTAIEGIPIAELKTVLASEGEAAVFARIRLTSLAHVAYSGLGTAASGADDFLNKVNDVDYLKNHPEGVTRFNDYVTKLSDAEKSEAAALSKTMMTETKTLASAGSKALNKLGIVGTLVGFTLAAVEAGKAEAAGNSEAAKDTMMEWAADAAGSFAGQELGAAIGGIALAAGAAVGVTVSAPVAAAVMFGATVIGAIFCADGAKGIYQLTKDLDHNGTMDLLDKFANTVFGAYYTISSPLPADLDGDRLTLDTSFSREDIVANARTNIAWRYALRELNPFVIPDISYDAHNTDGSLDLFDPETGTGTMTDAYLQDRAAMLAWKVRYDKGEMDDDDGPHLSVKPYNEDWDTSSIQGNWDFVDMSIKLPGGSPLTLAIDGVGLSTSDHQIVFGTKDDDVINGDGDLDHLFGMAGNDTLSGLAGDDYLEGGLGNDSLDGGSGNDTLIGGAGSNVLAGGEGYDTYIVGAGTDTLTDSDGKGVIKLADGTLVGLFTQGGSGYTWASDTGVSAQKVGTSLVVSLKNGSTLTLGDYHDGDYGIALEDTPTPTATGRTIVGDLCYHRFVPGIGLVYGGTLDDLGNYDAALAEPPGNPIGSTPFPDTLNDSAGDDLIQSGGNDDVVLALQGGNDRIEAGEGDDRVLAGAGNDIVLGQAGSDLLQGQAGNDRLYASNEIALGDAIAQGATQAATNSRGDWLDGGSDDDWLIGDAGDDLLTGGAGADILVGGGGNDDLLGDDEADLAVPHGMVELHTLQLTATPIDWHADRSSVSGGGVDLYQLDYRNASVTTAAGGNDALYGGAGDDWLHGGGGNDVLDGGADNDVAWGDAGDDTVLGGSGSDVLSGDAPDLSASGFGLAGLPGAEHGNDYLDGGAGDDTLYGNGGSDTLFGDEGDDRIDGDDGLTPGQFHGADLLDGGAGKDSLAGGGGADQLFGGADNDLLFGDNAVGIALDGVWQGADTLDGGAGNDTLVGGGGADVLAGGDGNDVLFGDAAPGDSLDAAWQGNDILDGGLGDDSLTGDGGDDRLSGGDGKDTLRGGDGADTLDGGTGVDVLMGDAGDDVYLLNAGDSPTDASLDTINDTVGSNRIVFGDGVDVDAVRMRSAGSDLVIDYTDSDSVYIVNGSIASFSFADGSTWTLDQLRPHALDEAVNLASNEAGGHLTGGRRGDTLTDSAGGSTFIGGLGNDTLTGAGGNNTYVFNIGDGVDHIADSGAGNTLQFGLGIAPEMLTLGLGSLRLDIDDGFGDAVHLDNFNPDAAADGCGIDRFQFGGDTVLTYEELLARGFDIAGTDQADMLGGTSVADRITGGTGDDTLIGGAGDDVYLFNWGDGQDVIDNTDVLAATDTLRFGDGIADSAVHAARDGGDLVLSIADTTDQVRLAGYYGAATTVNGQTADRKIDRVEFANGVVWDQAMIETVVARDANHAPTVNLSLPVLQARSGVAFNYTVPADTIVDGDAGDSVTYGATLADGSVLPNWLAFDAATRTLSGTPGGGDVGTLSLVLRGTDKLGAWTSETVSLAVAADQAPVLANALPDQTAFLGTAFSCVIAADAFTDPDGDALTYSASLSDGTALPSWLSFDAATRTFSGLPDGVGTTSVKVTAKDAGNLAASDVFDIASRILGFTLNGGTGNDTLTGGNGDDVINGNAGNDSLAGSYGNDTLDGGAGDDVLQGGPGYDVYLFGKGGGCDTVDSVSNPLPGSADRVQFKPGVAPEEVVVRRYMDDLVLSIAGTGDQLTLSGFFTADGGGIFRDPVQQVSFDDGTVWDADALTQKMLTGSAGADAIVGTAGNDSIDGGAGNDTISGGAGDDTLIGGTGDDTLSGAAGNDVYVYRHGDGNDLITEYDSAAGRHNVLQFEDLLPTDVSATRDVNWAPRDLQLTIKDGSGSVRISDFFTSGSNQIQEVRFSDDTVWTAKAMHDMLTPVSTRGDDILYGFDDTDDILDGQSGDDVLYGLDGNDVLSGSAGRDTVDGGYGNDSLDGGTGNDSLLGGSGDDTIHGGAGDDTLSGGYGNDTYLFGRGDGYDVINESSGADRLVLGAGILPEDVSLFRNSASAGDLFVVVDDGTSQVRVVGNFNQGWQYLEYQIEQIVFDGGNGPVWSAADIAAKAVAGAPNAMVGTTADDTYVVDDLADQISEPANGGTDTVYSSVSYTLPENIENLTLTGSMACDATGNALNNVMIGNSANNVFVAIGDNLDSRGHDTLIGGAGNDRYCIGVDDTVVENPGEGNDTIVVYSTGFSLTLPDNIENLEVAARTIWSVDRSFYVGNSLDNVIVGRSYTDFITWNGQVLTDVIDGGAGADTMIGAAGSFKFIVDDPGDTVSIHLDTFAQTIASRNEVVSSVSFALGPDLGKLTLTGSDPISGTGNELANVINGTTNSAANVLAGGAGDDTYIVGLGDTVVEAPGEGNDRLEFIAESGGSYYAADFATANVEAIGLCGSAQNVKLIGSTAADNLFAVMTDESSESVTLDGGDGNDILTTSRAYYGGSLLIGRDHDILLGGAGNDRLQAATGNDYLDGGNGADTMIGGAGYDTYVVDDIGDVINDNGGYVRSSISYRLADGFDGSLDLIGSGSIDATGNDKANWITGNIGNNRLSGGLGNDTYVFNKGGGQDSIDNLDVLSAIDTLQFGTGIADTDVTVSRSDDDLLLKVAGTTDQVSILGYFAPDTTLDGQAADRKIDRVWFYESGVVWDQALIQSQLQDGAANHAPVVNGSLTTQHATVGSAFNYVMPADTFTDPDAGDSLSYDARLASGDPLPTWLAFDATICTLTGTPTANDRGDLSLRITATDPAGASASTTFGLSIAGVNSAPTVASTIADQSATEDAPFNFKVPASTFIDVDAGDTLGYTATLGDDSPLPAWLTFDTATQIFSGTPANGDVGTLNLKVIATDTANASASTSFNLAIANVNDAPTLATAIPGQSATEDILFGYTIPAGTFADVDAGDALSYAATLADDSALPAWLTFAAPTRTFSGTPTNGDAGTLSIKVIATDKAGASASTSFNVAIANVNDAPTLATAIPDQSATEDTVFSFTIPGGTFMDVDSGDALTYTATLADGSPLPTWLNFDATSRTFSGTPTNGDVGFLDLKAIATDTVGASTSANFSLAVANVNDAPTLVNAVADQSATAGTAFSFTVPAGTFMDIDAGDALTYTATLADDSPLPAWLTFDAASQTFSGTPIHGDVGTLSLKVTAIDTGSLNDSDVFNLAILAAAPTNTAPIVVMAIDDQTASEDTAFSFTVPAGTFADMDVGDTLSYKAKLADDSPLPAWLTFDAATQTFSGRPNNDDVGTLGLRVTATDLGGASAMTGFALTVVNVNDAPTLAHPIADQTATEGTAFSLVIPANTFSDIDAGDTLSYSASLSDNGPLPPWLSFDATKHTFSGTPTSGNLGTLNLRIAATDHDGLTATDSFAITVSALSGVVMTGTIYSDNLAGTDGDDVLDGGAGNDVITGSAGDDTIIGGTGNDTLKGGAGNDTFLVSGTDTGYDRFEGGDGFDVIRGSAGNDTFRMFNYSGTSTVERIDGGGGTDVIAGTTYGDTLDFSATELVGIAAIDGGVGNDAITGSAGNDTLIGGTGNDTLKGGTGDDIFLVSGTGAGYDRFEGGDGFDVILGSAGNDTFGMYGYGGTTTVERIDGGGGFDVIAGTSYSDTLDFSTTELVGIAAIDGGAGSDTITGSAGNDTIIGGASNDVLTGGAGNDTFLVTGTGAGYDRFAGGDGFDVILGSAGNDIFGMYGYGGLTTVERIDGGGGTDVIAGTANNDTLDFSTTELIGIAGIDGGAGSDTITGSAGNDTIIGGTGNDVLAGSAGDDTFLVSGTDAGFDRFTGGDGFDVILGSAGNDTFGMYGYGGTSTVERIDGGGGTDVIAGTANSDTLDFSATELLGIAAIDGGAGSDTITGSAGNDTIIGGTGNDTLKGGAGDDTYVLGRGYGTDTVIENDSTAGNTDVASFLSDISVDQLWFRHVGNNLEVSVIGTSDKLTIQDWYSGSACHVEQFKTADNQTLLDSKVENLVQAMAAFSPPAAGQTTLPTAYQTALEPVIAANWQ